jgi:hypothetical protein
MLAVRGAWDAGAKGGTYDVQLLSREHLVGSMVSGGACNVWSVRQGVSQSCTWCSLEIRCRLLSLVCQVPLVNVCSSSSAWIVDTIGHGHGEPCFILVDFLRV